MTAVLSDESDDHLAHQLYYEELRLAKQHDDDAALALALQLSADASENIGHATPDTNTTEQVAPAMTVDLAKALIADEDRELALQDALDSVRAANACDLDGTYALMIGQTEQAKCFLSRLDQRWGEESTSHDERKQPQLD